VFPGTVREARPGGFRFIGYDRPGFGGSTARPGRVVADCAEDVRAILASLGVSRIAVWGSSAGGPYALATAALLPRRSPRCACSRRSVRTARQAWTSPAA
jgi:pimeloyl-ACP methyl ester carboxylesterase